MSHPQTERRALLSPTTVLSAIESRPPLTAIRTRTWDAMKALVYHAPGEKSWQDMPEPQIQRPTDAIVRIDTTTICGTDLHIMKGDVPAVTPGRILGHEGVGEIVELGSDVSRFAVGDKVIISCIKSCRRCSFCQSSSRTASVTRARRGSAGCSVT
jgi:alcohol dehydrogenase